MRAQINYDLLLSASAAWPHEVGALVSNTGLWAPCGQPPDSGLSTLLHVVVDFAAGLPVVCA